MELDMDLEQTQRFVLPEVANSSRSKVAGLVVIEGMNLGSTYNLEPGRYLIGRSPDAHIHIDNYLVSRFHSELRLVSLNPLQCMLRDLNSTNGTFVNDQPAKELLLRDGDKIRVGDHVLKFVYQDEQDLQYHAKVHEMIRYDDLTGLLTKNSFYKELSREISRAWRRGYDLAVLMMDIDHFKNVNDTHGHLIGSAVLQQTGALIRNTFRELDISGRYGGEEFITFFPETSRGKAITGAERLRVALEEHVFTYKEVKLHITISIGISGLPEDGNSIETLVRNADIALYEAKKTGRNKVVLYTSDLSG